MCCLKSACAFLASFRITNLFVTHIHMYGLAQHKLVHIKGRVWQSLQLKSYNTHSQSGSQMQSCRYPRSISFMLTTCHESICGERDHKPVWSGDKYEKNGWRGKLSSLLGFDRYDKTRQHRRLVLI